MTFEDYIKNPQGSGAAVFANRQAIKQFYETKFNNILLREDGKIQYTLYNQDDDIYYIHIKVPSEVIPKFYYDVVVKFYKERNTGVIYSNLNTYDVQFYSNDPNFVFSFAHAFKKKNMFIDELSHKMNKLSLQEVSSIRNPSDQIGYVKSIYFAYLIMKKYGLFQKQKWVSKKPYTKKVWDSVQHAEEKIELRQKAEEKLRRERKSKEASETNTSKKNVGWRKVEKHPSPNIKNFGKFKKQNFNPIAKIASNFKRHK